MLVGTRNHSDAGPDSRRASGNVQRLKTNYVVVVGDAECEDGSISVKCREQDKSPGTVSVDVFLALLEAEGQAATLGTFPQE